MSCKDCGKKGPVTKIRYRAHNLRSREELERHGLCLAQETVKALCPSCLEKWSSFTNEVNELLLALGDGLRSAEMRDAEEEERQEEGWGRPLSMEEGSLRVEWRGKVYCVQVNREDMT